MLALIFDTDWAPDFAIDETAALLARADVRATWFVTHASPAIDRLRERPELFELGIHPNFLPGSTHGKSPDAVLRRCAELVPGAVSMRTHGLMQSTPLLAKVLARTDVRLDASLMLPRAENLAPVEHHWGGKRLLRVPVCWEDDFEMQRPEPCWDLDEVLGAGKGLKVLAFHPIHVFLNSRDMGPYNSLKESSPCLGKADPESARDLVQPGPGTRTLLKAAASRAGRDSVCMRDLLA